jgi:hypothetical protein
MAPGIPGIPNDVQGPAPDAPFRRSPRYSDTSDEPENLSYAKHSAIFASRRAVASSYFIDAPLSSRVGMRGNPHRLVLDDATFA